MPVRPSLLSGSLETFFVTDQSPPYLVRKLLGLLVFAAEKGNTIPRPPSKSSPRASRSLRNCLVKVPAWTCDPPMCIIRRFPAPSKRTASILWNKVPKEELSPGNSILFLSKRANSRSGRSLLTVCPQRIDGRSSKTREYAVRPLIFSNNQVPPPPEVSCGDKGNRSR